MSNMVKTIMNRYSVNKWEYNTGIVWTSVKRARIQAELARIQPIPVQCERSLSPFGIVWYVADISHVQSVPRKLIFIHIIFLIWIPKLYERLVTWYYSQACHITSCLVFRWTIMPRDHKLIVDPPSLIASYIILICCFRSIVTKQSCDMDVRSGIDLRQQRNHQH